MSVEHEAISGGTMNELYLSTSGNSDQTLELIRVSRPDLDTQQTWEELIYPFIGFYGDGGRLHWRTPREQFEFSNRAAASQLRVVAARELVGGDLRVPYLPAAWHLNTYLVEYPQQTARLTHQLFTDLRRAHSKSFVYGDRYGSNILVTDPAPGGKPEVWHVDFDVEPRGPRGNGDPIAFALEVAETTRTLLNAAPESMGPLTRWLGMQNPWFDLNTVARYLTGHVELWERSGFRRTPGNLTERLLSEAYRRRSGLIPAVIEPSTLAINALDHRIAPKDVK